MAEHSPFPGVTAWYQAWKPNPSTLLSETKATRRRLALVLRVGGGTLPHTLQGAKLGGDGGSELRASRSGGCLGPAVLLPQALTRGGRGQKGSFHFPGSSDSPDCHVPPCGIYSWTTGWELHLTERSGDLPKVMQQAGGRAGPPRSGFWVSSQSNLSHTGAGQG